MPWGYGSGRARRWGENHRSNPIEPRPIARSSSVDILRRQIEELKAKAGQEEAKPGAVEQVGQWIDYAKEISRLEEILEAVQMLEAAGAKCRG